MQIKFFLLSRIILSATLLIGEFIFVSSALAGPAPCTAEYLIFKINDANSTPATTDTIDLPNGCIYTLTQVDNKTAGNNGLPAITSPIIINGHHSTIQRSLSAQEWFRLFYVSFQGDLTLGELTLTGGYSYNPANPNDVSTNSGGAIRNAGHLTVVKSTIKENRGREGGGIFNLNQMTLSDVAIEANEDYFGLPGGAGIHNQGNAVLTNTTISHNGFRSYHPADGVYNAAGAYLEMMNSTVSRNAGCAVDNAGGGELVLNHVTISFNDACAVVGGDLYTSNSILMGGCGDIILHAVFPNLTTHPSCGGPVVDLAALKLEPLADNGGATQTNALGAGSVAIDMVVRECLPTDQRGVSRPQGAKCDVGAYEYVAPAP